MPRRHAGLHEVDITDPGILRRRSGRGFTYLHASGRRVRHRRTLARIKALVIPPAWTDVWICPDPLGHIQAVGVDDRGRRQYRYHDDWRVERDREKHDRVLELAEFMPRLRERVAADLVHDDLDRDRVLAAAIRLLELGLFRVGGERYVDENDSYGLATLQKRHVRVRGDELAFDYPAKSGQRRKIVIDDPELAPVVAALKRRRRGGTELLAYKDDRGHWTDVRSADINGYLRAAVGDGYSSKDVRTWAGTVLAAVALAAEDATGEGGGGAGGGDRPPAQGVPRAMKQVAEQLGNTPAVARSSYVDPRVITSYEHGTTVDPDSDDIDDVEAAVIELIEEA